jgi:tRNA pseudouridine55 synthase
VNAADTRADSEAGRARPTPHANPANPTNPASPADPANPTPQANPANPAGLASPSTPANPAGAAGRAGRRTTSAAWSGLLLVDKPRGVTSHDAVERVRRRLRVKPAGHLGTLDPSATGLLVVAIGAATRCASVWQGGDKTYEGTAHFGIVTDSQDLTGEVLEERPVAIDEARVRTASRALVGDLMQVPPMVSALKVDGTRLYRLARRGIEVERDPRPIRVASWDWLSFDLPRATFRVQCSGGTYVRTLVHDLGAALGTGAALGALRRLRSEPFAVDHALTFRDLDAHPGDRLLLERGLPLERALVGMPTLRLDAEAATLLGYGGRPRVSEAAAPGIPAEAGPRSVVFTAADGRVLALGEVRRHEEGLLVCPHLVFPWAVREGRL